MTNSGVDEQLESVADVYLREISEPTENSLRVVVEEAAKSDKAARRFELFWPSCAAYMASDGEVGANDSGGDDQAYTGRILCLYSKSHFLEYLSRDAGKRRTTLLHYKLICLNRQIDVAAYVAPEIRAVRRQAEKKDPASRHIGGIIGPY